jgi:menaquinone-dependent protoporphyrinogen oxidase
VNLVARKPGRDQPDSNPYVKKFLRQIAWQPQHVAIFAGKLNCPIYNWFDRNIIRLIMFITKGPTDPTTVREFTDWQKVDAFGLLVSDME